MNEQCSNVFIRAGLYLNALSNSMKCMKFLFLDILNYLSKHIIFNIL